MVISGLPVGFPPLNMRICTCRGSQCVCVCVVIINLCLYIRSLTFTLSLPAPLSPFFVSRSLIPFLALWYTCMYVFAGEVVTFTFALTNPKDVVKTAERMRVRVQGFYCLTGHACVCLYVCVWVREYFFRGVPETAGTVMCARVCCVWVFLFVILIADTGMIAQDCARKPRQRLLK